MGKYIVYGIDVETKKSFEITDLIPGESHTQGILRARDLMGTKYIQEFYVEHRALIYLQRRSDECYRDWLIRNGIVVPKENIKKVRYQLAHQDLYIQLEDDKWYWYDESKEEFKYTQHGPL